MTEFVVPSASREHKDRLFNFIFGRPENKKWTLSLYNALNGSFYEDETKIEFNTLENYLYVSMKNDTSFLFAGFVNLYEHQSSFNPNMPLRMMQYISHIYEGYIVSNGLNKFSETVLELPSPRLVVFYNGGRDEPDEQILRLSDSFSKDTRENVDIEVKVKMLNINYGHNKRLMELCRPLYEYSWFVQRIREYKKTLDDLGESVGKAITDMPEDYILKPFLREHMSEVASMLSEELQELNAKQMIAKASFKEGVTSMTGLIGWLLSQNREDDIHRMTYDSEYLDKLFYEYDEWKKNNK